MVELFIKKILLAHYGYNFEGWAENDSYKNVDPKNFRRVKSLLISRAGIGWAVKAFIIYWYYFPYLLIVYTGTYLLKRKSKRINSTN